MTRVLNIISGLPAAAGTTLFCVEVCDRLASRGVEPVILARDLVQGEMQRPRSADVKVELLPPCRSALDRWRGPRELARRMCRAAGETGSTVVHVHALWDPFVHAGCRAASRLGLPLIVSPHGMATPWALQHRAYKKQVAWRLYQRADLREARVLHATAPAEADDLRALGFHQPIAIVPLGVDLPPPRANPATGACAKPVRRILFLSRVHPKKGLLNLVEAWRRVRQPGWVVVIAGPDEGGHGAEVSAAAARAGVRDDFQFTGPVFHAAKDELYRKADLFVLPSYSENFGAVVPEALAHGVPVITTHATPWRELEGPQPGRAAPGRSGWWIALGVEPLAQALREAMRLTDAERAAMGENGRRLVAATYHWDMVAEQMGALYAWVLHGGQAPACVRAD